MRLLLLPKAHPNKIMSQTTHLQKGVCLGRIKTLLMEIIPSFTRQENDVRPSQFVQPSAISIPLRTKNTLAIGHNN